jgi:hypothetical protein
LAVAVAFLLVVGAVGGTLGLAATAFANAERPAADRHAAATATDRLVAADGPLAVRENVLGADMVDTLDATTVAASVPTLQDRAFRVELDDRVLAARGDPDGVTHRRIVVVARTTTSTRNVSQAVTLPRRTDRIRFGFANASVDRVRVNGRVVLARPGGLRGTVTVDVSRRATLRVTFAGTGTVRLTTFPERTRKARLEVTVGD